MRDPESDRTLSPRGPDPDEPDHFRRLFEEMGDAAYLVETETGRILACNEAATQQTGYSKDELLGLNILFDLSCGAPDIGLDRLTEGLRKKEKVRFIQSKHRKDGSVYWEEVVVVPFRNGLHPIHISVNRDISDQMEREKALRDSETRYRSIFESTTDAILVFDQNGILVEANPNAYRMYGYAQGEFIGRPANEIIHPDFFHGFANFRAGIERDGHFVSRSVNLRKDGTPFDVEVHGARFTYQGEPHLLSVVRNIEDQVRAERSLEASRFRLEHLHDAATDLEACHAKDRVYQLTVHAAKEILSFDVCSLCIAEGDTLVVKATSAGLAETAAEPRSIDGDSVAAQTFRTRKTLRFEVPDKRGVPETSGALQLSGISLPVGTIGVFQAASTSHDAFSEEDARLLELLLGHTAQAVERIHLQEELVRQANHDVLTGLYNRRYFNQVIERELARSRRHTHPIGFLMIDVNRFKEINDRFGHQTGDKVLQTVASLLVGSVRESDLVIRYGGDEFLVVLMETGDLAETACARIEAAVARKNRGSGVVPFPVTLSIGSAYWDPSAEETLESVLSKADLAMYAVKRRNSVKD